MLTLCTILFVLIRWRLLEPILGTKRMYLFDTVMFTIAAAVGFAQPGPWPWFGYFCSAVCLLWAYTSSKKYLHFDFLTKNIKHENKNPDPK